MIFIVVAVYIGYGESSPWTAYTSRSAAEIALSAFSADPKNDWIRFHIVECELF